MIRAVTFDLWDTIVADDSDEPRRAARGLASKVATRRQLFISEVRNHHQDIGEERASEGWDAANEWFRHCWKVEHHTPGLDERVRKGFEALGIEPTPGFSDLVQALAQMEVEIPPDAAPGIEACLRNLHGRYKLGIVSDAIVTPGSGLREILAKHGVADVFEIFVFSDEAGASKPDRKVFDVAAAGFGCEVHEILHIGDREYNDIGGPLGCGAKAVLYTGVIDRGATESRAHAVCSHHDDLPGIIDRLSGE